MNHFYSILLTYISNWYRLWRPFYYISLCTAPNLITVSSLLLPKRPYLFHCLHKMTRLSKKQKFMFSPFWMADVWDMVLLYFYNLLFFCYCWENDLLFNNDYSSESRPIVSVSIILGFEWCVLYYSILDFLNYYLIIFIQYIFIMFFALQCLNESLHLPLHATYDLFLSKLN